MSVNIIHVKQKNVFSSDAETQLFGLRLNRKARFKRNASPPHKASDANGHKFLFNDNTALGEGKNFRITTFVWSRISVSIIFNDFSRNIGKIYTTK